MDDLLACQVLLAVIDHRQVVAHFDESAGCICGTLGASVTGHGALVFSIVAKRFVFTSHPQVVADRLEGKESLGTNFDAIPARRAESLIHHRQAEFVHYDGVKIADLHAVAISETTPSTAFPAPRH